MLTLAFSMVAYIRAFFGPRHQFALEAAALRQQLAVLKRNQTHLRLHRLDRFFWTALRRVYSGGPAEPIDHREAGNRGFLASGRLSFVLAVAVPATSARTSEGAAARSVS